MLKTTESSEDLALNVFRANSNEVVGDIGSSKADKTFKNLSKSKKLKNDKSKSLTCCLNIKATEESTFLTPGAKKVFNHLRQAFVKAPIFLHFDSKYHIQIKTNASGYAIGRVLS